MKNKYIPVHASLADIVLVIQEMQKSDQSIKINSKEILEYVLFTYFGFDKSYKEFIMIDENGDKSFNWYDVENVLHRPELTKTPTKCDRYSGQERLDKEWYESGKMSDIAWKVYKGV